MLKLGLGFRVRVRVRARARVSIGVITSIELYIRLGFRDRCQCSI